LSKSICFCSSTHETKYSSKDKDISMMNTDQQQIDHQIRHFNRDESLTRDLKQQQFRKRQNMNSL